MGPVAAAEKKQTFAGDKKHLIHCLAPLEKRIIAALLPKVPMNVTTVHLTLCTLLWSAGVITAGALAVVDMRWLWLFSACIVLQHVTDMLDGAVGRARNTGLIKWGFYMDHFLDYVFLS
jgi:phosphatidylglycerophosphate synthase